MLGLLLNIGMNIGANMLIRNKNKGNTQNQGGNKGNQGGYYNQNHGQGLGVLNQQNQMYYGNNAQGNNWIQQQKRMNQYSIIRPQQNQQFDLNSLLLQQVVFIQPSPAKQKLQELKRTGQAFLDQRFPPNESSLTGEYGPQSDWKGITWKKATQMMKNPVLFHGKPMPSDIRQGYLGDCYFLAGLAALAERPDRIFNLFLLQEMNQQRYFSVKMLYKGKWMTIDMDEYIPWSKTQPAFSKSNQDELWVLLLEKAWAKLYTSYKRIQAGYAEEAIHDLTGAPIKQISLHDSSFNFEQEWMYLMDAAQRQYAMIASSQPGSDRNKSVSGVVQGHAYTLLNATTITFNGRQERIVQLRNPWGKGEFTGKWSDGDQNWYYISPQEKQRIGFNPDKNDGIFWMPYEVFIDEFRTITVAEIDDNASYVYRSVKDPQCKGVYFAVDILKQDLYAFQVDKTPQRIYPDQYQQMFKYPQTLIQVGLIQGNQCGKMQGLRSTRRTLVKKERLGQGTYVVFVKISYHPDFEDQYDVNLAVYSSTVCNIRLATQKQAAIYTNNPNVQWSGEQQQQSTEPWNTMGNVQSQGNNNFRGKKKRQHQQMNYGGNQGGGNQGWGNNQGFGGQGNNQGNQGWGGGQQGGNQGFGQGFGGQGGFNQGYNEYGQGNTQGYNQGYNQGYGQGNQQYGQGNNQWGQNNNQGWGQQQGENIGYGGQQQGENIGYGQGFGGNNQYDQGFGQGGNQQWGGQGHRNRGGYGW